MVVWFGIAFASDFRVFGVDGLYWFVAVLLLVLCG